MKKLFILLFSILVSYNSHGDEIISIFGLTLYDNAEDFYSSSYINSNRYKNDETIEGYFDLNISDKIKSKSPYFSTYYITINDDNYVNSIYGHYKYTNLDICLAVNKSLLTELEEKYRFESEYFEEPYPTFKLNGNFHWTPSDNYFSLQCKENYSDGSVLSQIILHSRDFAYALNKFYDSGL